MRFLTIVIAVLSMGSAAQGCTILEESAHDSTVVEVGTLPYAIESSPHDTYLGKDVYFYESHWYFRRANVWFYYQEEPAELRSRRQRQLSDEQITPGSNAR